LVGSFVIGLAEETVDGVAVDMTGDVVGSLVGREKIDGNAEGFVDVGVV
jgi:hypothetical protein